MEQKWLIVPILLVFTLVAGLKYQHTTAEDLCSSYMGARMLADGHPNHLYSYDKEIFSHASDPLWTQTAAQHNALPPSALHPYVQTPLWAWLLKPIAVRLEYPQFSRIFEWMFAACFSLWLAMTVFDWAPRLQNPIAVSILCCLLFVFQPFRYAMSLGQTHVLYMLAAFAAVALARRDRPVAAGLLLAFAAAVKLTPALIGVYWLLTRKPRAAAVFAVASVLLVWLSIATTGWALFTVYLHRLQQISHTLLIAFNNQSLAAWWPNRHDPIPDLFQWRIFPLPAVPRVLGNVLMLASTLLGAWLDRALRPGTPPYGAVLVLVATSVFAPINWLHYAVLLIVPLILLADAAIANEWGKHSRRAAALVCFVLAIYALNIYPESWAFAHQRYSLVPVIRLQFYAELLAMAALAMLARWRAVANVGYTATEETPSGTGRSPRASA